MIRIFFTICMMFMLIPRVSAQTTLDSMVVNGINNTRLKYGIKTLSHTNFYQEIVSNHNKNMYYLHPFDDVDEIYGIGLSNDEIRSNDSIKCNPIRYRYCESSGYEIVNVVEYDNEDIMEIIALKVIYGLNSHTQIKLTILKRRFTYICLSTFKVYDRNRDKYFVYITIVIYK